MKKYYVTLVNEKNCDENVVLVTHDIDQAKERAVDEQHYITRDKRKNERVEIRLYVEDIDNENCTCFDYNLIEF